MRHAVTFTRADLGIEAQQVAVEVHVGGGLAAFSIVGLPETVVKESRHRVRSAIQISRFKFPSGRITVNLAPAELPKEGGRYDLAIALGILAASEQIPKAALVGYEFGAELALTGELRDFYRVIPMVASATKAKHAVFLAPNDANFAVRVQGAVVLTATTLLEVCEHLAGAKIIAPLSYEVKTHDPITTACDLSEVEGQYQAKRALEIAAAGGHSLLMIGSPGVGKTMLASRLPGILPPLTNQEALEVAAVHALTPEPTKMFIHWQRPFRAPHHSSSSIALVGGGRTPKPGEVSLAHHGVLFLDELPEFNRAGLEALREPLESGVVNIARAAYNIQYPANFQLIAAMNPCPCGYAVSDQERCHCSAEQIHRYQHKISGPLLDRIDLQVQMAEIKIPFALTRSARSTETSPMIAGRVQKAQQRQKARQTTLNAKLSQAEMQQVLVLSAEDQQYCASSSEKLGLSLRAYFRLLKVARTIADLAECDAIQREHLQEAFMFRKLDKLQ